MCVSRPYTSITNFDMRSCEVSPSHELRVPAQNDVSASSRHVGGNGHCLAAPALSHHLRFPLHILGLGIQQLQQARAQQICQSAKTRLTQIQHDTAWSG